ncbi:MAG: insulinase family protein [Azospirillum sp.]|nr:insulinase family protein [Azospirillum sp.]
MSAAIVDSGARRRRLLSGAGFGVSLLVAALAATAAGAAPAGVYFPETFTLANGLQVVVVTNRRVPVVTQMVWYKVGAADDPTGHSGIAHFLEHLMFKGTDTLAPGEFSRTIAKNGGQDNAFTSWDYTSYVQTVARDRLELVMRMEADRMANLRLTDAVVYPERDVVLEERRQRVENRPGDRFGEQLNATVFVHHPYGIPILGWKHEIEALTREDAERFYRTWYVPNNAVLVVAGDVDAAELRPLAEKYYGVIPARPVPERQRTREPELTAERRVVLRDAEVRQPQFRREYLAPSYHRGATEYAYALQVLSQIMSGGATSRLHRRLVVERKLATAVWLGYSPSSFDLATVSLGASPAPGVEMPALETALDDEIAALLAEGVSDEEVATAKRRMLAEAAFARDSLSGPAYAFGTAIAIGRSPEDVEAWPQRIDAVSRDQVNAAARHVLSRGDAVTGLLLPAQSGRGS